MIFLPVPPLFQIAAFSIRRFRLRVPVQLLSPFEPAAKVERNKHLAVFSSGLAFEIECHCGVKVLTGGGHADEREACLEAGGGVCFYNVPDARRRRWTALESHAQVRALWILPGARSLDELDDYVPFTM